MKILSQAVAALSVAFTAPAGPSTKAQSHESTPNLGSLRIMPLGGSITWGQGSQDGNGYRKFLHDSLTSSGYTVDMIGSQRNGDMDDPDNEGHPNYRITDLTSSLNTTFLTSPLHSSSSSSLASLSHSSSIVLLTPPTLDISQNHRLPSTSDQHTTHLSSLLDKIFTSSPSTTVILSTLLPNSNEDTNARIDVVNQQLRRLAARQRQRESRRKLVLVEMNDGKYITRRDLMAGDSTHPGEQGWRKMAVKWREGIDEAERRGFFAGKEEEEQQQQGGVVAVAEL